MTSFAVVLTLGGGPASTTVEVAIYQALRFDYDPSRAALLALLQLGISAAVILTSQNWSRSLDLFATAGRAAERPDRKSLSGQLFDFSTISLAAVFLLTPLGAIALAGLQPTALGVWINPNVWAAAGRSLGVAAIAGISAVLAALALQLAIRSLYRHKRKGTARMIDLSGSIVLGLSPLAFGAGLFLLLVGIVGPFRWSLAPVVLLSAFLALPFAMHLLGPPLMHSDQLYHRLCGSLGIAGWARWRLVDWPVLRPSVGFALALAVSLSVGDLASIALFGSPDNATLPLLLYQLMGSYRMTEAAGVSLVFIMLVIVLFMGIERVIGGRYSARH
jgi:thiamine transport system permease protein